MESSQKKHASVLANRQCVLGEQEKARDTLETPASSDVTEICGDQKYHKENRGSNFHVEEMPLKLFDTRLWDLGHPRLRNYNVSFLHGCSSARTTRKDDRQVCHPCQMKTRAEGDECDDYSVLGHSTNFAAQYAVLVEI